MKKLIAVVMMLFAFTVTANAQDAKQSGSKEDVAKKDVVALTSKITIDQNMQDSMYRLMLMKYEMLAQAQTPAEKTKVSDMVEHKIMASITEEQRQQLKNSPALLKQLTQ